MVNLPLNLKLKKKAERNIAYAQDVLVEELYRFFPNAVIHGGTGIWRCYNGNRFSEDVDVYIEKNDPKINEFFRLLEKRGFKIIKKRIKENSVYSELIFNETVIRFEATFQTKKPILRNYETSESFFINVYTLTAEEFVVEKIETYMKRLKIRDLYDIYFMLNYVENQKIVEPYLKKLIKNYEKPKDEENLANIIISGVVPDSNEIFIGIKRWVK